MGIRRVAKGGRDDEDGERRDAKSAAHENQISSVARPLLLGRRFPLRLSELFDVVSVFAHTTRSVAANAAVQYYQLLVGNSRLVSSRAQIATIAR